jgi:hypothetical protein
MSAEYRPPPSPSLKMERERLDKHCEDKDGFPLLEGREVMALPEGIMGGDFPSRFFSSGVGTIA